MSGKGDKARHDLSKYGEGWERIWGCRLKPSKECRAYREYKQSIEEALEQQEYLPDPKDMRIAKMLCKQKARILSGK